MCPEATEEKAQKAVRWVLLISQCSWCRRQKSLAARREPWRPSRKDHMERNSPGRLSRGQRRGWGWGGAGVPQEHHLPACLSFYPRTICRCAEADTKWGGKSIIKVKATEGKQNPKCHSHTDPTCKRAARVSGQLLLLPSPEPCAELGPHTPLAKGSSWSSWGRGFEKPPHSAQRELPPGRAPAPGAGREAEGDIYVPGLECSQKNCLVCIMIQLGLLTPLTLPNQLRAQAPGESWEARAPRTATDRGCDRTEAVTGQRL